MTTEITARAYPAGVGIVTVVPTVVAGAVGPVGVDRLGAGTLAVDSCVVAGLVRAVVVVGAVVVCRVLVVGAVAWVVGVDVVTGARRPVELGRVARMPATTPA